MGQFTTPQKRPTMQRPAPKEGLRPTSGPSRHPMVEPTKKEGTISPPFMPQPMVMAVSRSLMIPSQGRASPSMAPVITSDPAPLYRLVPSRSDMPITSAAPTATRRYRLGKNFPNSLWEVCMTSQKRMLTRAHTSPGHRL